MFLQLYPNLKLNIFKKQKNVLLIISKFPLKIILKLDLYKGKAISKNNKICKINNHIFFHSLKKNYKNLFLQYLKNNCLGLLFGFTKVIELKGVYFKFLKWKNILIINLGLSHLVFLKFPKNVFFKIKKKTIFLFSFYRDLLFKELYKIKKLKKVDVYKGKGFYFLNELPNLREGKQQFSK